MHAQGAGYFRRTISLCRVEATDSSGVLELVQTLPALEVRAVGNSANEGVEEPQCVGTPRLSAPFSSLVREALIRRFGHTGVLRDDTAIDIFPVIPVPVDRSGAHGGIERQRGRT